MRLEGRRPSAHLAGVSTALKIPPRMTVAEFLTWEPPDHWHGLWQLRDGEPEMMGASLRRSWLDPVTLVTAYRCASRCMWRPLPDCHRSWCCSR
jgi:hypothetical protein